MVQPASTALAAPGPRAPFYALTALAAAYASFYGALAWRRYATFHADVDLGYYVRLVWGLAHGHYDMPLVHASSILGLHLEPILLPVAAAHALGAPIVPMLLGLQALAVALLALPAYRLASRHLGSPWLGVLGALCALLYPTITVATLHDFHPVTLALPLLLGVVDALDERALKRALLLGGLALACREDIALQLFCLAALEGLRRRGRERLAALGLAALLIAYFAVYVFAIQPRFVPSAGSYGLHFASIGGVAIHSAVDLVRAALAHPLLLLGNLATVDRLLFPLLLLWPFALLGALAPRLLVGALPIFCINLLSDFPRVRTIEAHYTTAIAPFVIGASFAGAGRLKAWVDDTGRDRLRRVFRIVLPALLVAFVTAAHALYGGSPLSRWSIKWQSAGFVDPPNGGAIRAALAAVPDGASVSVHASILAHVADRPRAIWPPDFTDGLPVEHAIAIVPSRETSPAP
jgi:uncharacterized membrane protein